MTSLVVIGQQIKRKQGGGGSTMSPQPIFYQNITAFTPTLEEVGSCQMKNKIPPGNNKRWKYCFWSIFPFKGHSEKASILDFRRKKWKPFFFKFLSI